MDQDLLNKCIKDELSAIETYEQALGEGRAEHARERGFQELSRILRDHRQAAESLRSLMQRSGGTPAHGSGAWGSWAKTVMGSAKIFGDKATLKTLKEGEESGLKDYQEIAQDASASSEVQSTVSELMSKQQEHIRTLDRLMETA